MQADADRVLAQVREALAPRVLRAEIVVGFAQWREEFAPRMLVPPSQEAMMEELVRFLAHLQERRYLASSGERWPLAQARRDLTALFARVYGSSVGGEMALWRLAREQSMRAVLDALVRAMQEERLAAYLDARVLTPIRLLAPEDRYRVVEAYVREFRALAPLAQTEHPAILLHHLGDMFGKHARLVLGWQ